ncbi:MAG: VCBS repeat-containing protein [Candidatus Eisenbacteria bacterium]|nr:VCBS repeat-containing protein [Candidatus Eisenbacteria bacterium]
MMRRPVFLLSGADAVVRRLVALPECATVSIESIAVRAPTGDVLLSEGAAASVAGIESIGKLRDQTVAIVRLDLAALAGACGPSRRAGELEITIALEGAAGAASRDTGPFAHACSRTLLNYEPVAPPWRPPAAARAGARGGVAYCTTAAECAAAGTDVLIVAAADLASTPALRALALHHAEYLGLNVSIFSAGDLPALTPEALRDLIRQVYESRSAAGFGDGHLGFVLLVGDAYADDNQTVMVPAYNGYGGNEVASDHYYACVSGDDDFEDVMIGRLSVGNLADLVAVVTKCTGYMPVSSTQEWSSSVLLIGGMFYTLKSEYVALFNEYDEIIPDSFQVGRIYRHDFASDHACAIAVTREFNNGHLIVNFAGDGWVSLWDRTLNTTHIAGMENGDRLPIVLSMACATGGFDNTTYPDANGSYDCLAEQLVNAPGKGAVACLAAPRASDGGMFRTLTKSIYRAMFDEHALFIGEAIAVGKLLHLQGDQNVNYVRHFNLFGDPTLIFASDAPPTDAPDLALKPHETAWSPAFPGTNSTVTVAVTVTNQSAVPASNVAVRLTGQSPAGQYRCDAIIPFLGGWSSESAVLTIPDRTAGPHTVEIAADPDGLIAESNESNNAHATGFYVYRHASGFPVDLGIGLHSAAIGRLGNEFRTVTVDENASVRAVGPSGIEVWASPGAVHPLDFTPEIAPAIGDINGDGVSEVVATRRLGVAAFSGDGDTLWTLHTKDPVGYPVLADVNGDGISDILLATYGLFGETSDILALSGQGQQLWVRPLPQGAKPTASPVVGDINLDGRPDIIYGTSQGRIGALTTAASPPTHLWGPVQVSSSPVVALALGDVDHDGRFEVIVASNKLYCVNADDGSVAWNVPLDSDVCSLALGDVDGDRVPEIVAGSKNGTIYLLAGSTVSWSAPLFGRPMCSAAVADADGDGAPDIIVSTQAGFVRVLSSRGAEIAAVPVPGAPGSPFACDIDRDGVAEIAVATSSGMLFMLRLQGAAGCPVEWAGPGRNAARTGAYAQPLSGTINGSVTLSGEYTVTGDVIVPAGASLTLAPGTSLAFASGASPKLEVAGTLVAAGSAAAEVTMRASGPRGTWNGVVLLPGATAQLAVCRIENAEVGIFGMQSTVTLLGVTVNQNAVGMHLDDCTLTASACAFTDSDTLGARLAGGSGTIRASLFTENRRAGLVCRDGATHAITASTFSGSSQGDGIACHRLSTVVIDSCVVVSNARHGILIKNCSPLISNTTIRDNAFSGALCTKQAFPAFSRCQFVSNGVGVSAEGGANPVLGGGAASGSGYNSFERNATAAVANQASSVRLQALWNWWGQSPPNPASFIGRVDYAPWLTSPPATLTASVEEGDTPIAFALGQNTPNPFTPTTTLAFHVPAPGGEVAICVYDVSGRLVRTLASGFRDAGTHEAVWDGRDARGEFVAAGVYFARMDAPGSSSTVKLILLR